MVQPLVDADQDIPKHDDENAKPLVARIEDAVSSYKASTDTNSFRFRVENNKVSRIYWEKDRIETGSTKEVFHLHEDMHNSLWFTCAAACLHSTDTALWGFEMPESISSFVARPSIPCGVLVVLGLLPASKAPEWTFETDPAFQGFNIRGNPAGDFHSRRMARLAAEKLEATMPPEQARVHKMNRESAERRAMMDGMRQENAERMEKVERRMKEAIASPQWGYKRVAESCVAWLIEQGDVGREWSIERIVEAVLYLLVLDQGEDSEARRIGKVLEDWMDWSHAGGMRKSHVELLGRRKKEFCYAACLAAVVAETAGGSSNAGMDMLECLKQWRKVRLG
jgi:hypothetical protein